MDNPDGLRPAEKRGNSPLKVVQGVTLLGEDD